jgi:hypothetical protein
MDGSLPIRRAAASVSQLLLIAGLARGLADIEQRRRLGDIAVVRPAVCVLDSRQPGRPARQQAQLVVGEAARPRRDSTTADDASPSAAAPASSSLSSIIPGMSTARGSAAHQGH